MREQPDLAAIVDRIVRESNIPSAREREELRRELIAHFEDAARSSAALHTAIERFGSPGDIAGRFRRAYGRRYRVLYAAKVLASIAVSFVVALGLQMTVNLRLEPLSGEFRLGPLYDLAAFVSLILVLVAVVVWELGIEPLCARLERRPVQLLGAIGALSVGAYLTHLIIDRFIDPQRALMGSAATVAVWIATIAILSRFELAFIRRLGAAK